MRNVFICCFIVAAFISEAQNIIHRCAYDEAVQLNSRKFPAYQQAIQKVFDDARQHALTKNNFSGKRNSEDILRIPVVVHVVYKTSAQNIPDDLIFSQIE